MIPDTLQSERLADDRWQWDRRVELNFLGAIIGGALAGRGATKAAKIQAQAVERAAQLQAQSQREALAFERQRYERDQANLMPWLTAGKDALTKWQGLAPFQAPGADFEKDPGYEFRMSEGQKALERSAAARGGLLTTGTAKQLQRYGQDYGSNEYQNVYNRKFGEHTNQFNQLSSIAGTGQVAGQQISQSGASSGIPLILERGGNNQAAALNNAAYQRGSGYVASGNIWGNAASDVGDIGTLLALQRLSRGGQGSSGAISMNGGPLWTGFGR